jgi:hypothetical protein
MVWLSFFFSVSYLSSVESKCTILYSHWSSCLKVIHFYSYWSGLLSQYQRFWRSNHTAYFPIGPAFELKTFTCYDWSKAGDLLHGYLEMFDGPGAEGDGGGTGGNAQHLLASWQKRTNTWSELAHVQAIVSRDGRRPLISLFIERS